MWHVGLPERSQNWLTIRQIAACGEKTQSG